MAIAPADRLKHFSEYYFSKKLREIRQLIAQGRPVINLGIGSPDQMPEDTVIAALHESAILPDVHGYQPYQGIPELHAAIRHFYSQHYLLDLAGLSLLPLMGSKEGITHISLAYLNPGDQVLIPALGYPTYSSVTRMVGAEPVYFPLLENQNWEPDWTFLEALDTTRVKLMWLNYPHMPTGAQASDELLKRYVDFARERGILIGFDNPYSLLLTDKPQSVFNIPGADEVALELNSLSKSFNMAGWRIGWVAGAESLIQPVLQIKSNMDSGMFKPLQLAAVKALHLKANWFERLSAMYRERQQLGFRILDQFGCTYASDQAGMFVWGKVPNGTGEELSDRVLAGHDVFITPGFIFGEAGSAYIRISLCAPVQTLQEVYNRLV